MLMHSFVLDALGATGPDTFSHFEMLIDEHRSMSLRNEERPSRLKQLVPMVGIFHTPLPLRRAYEAYNKKYGISTRKHVCISFNEIRHILNLAQIMAFAGQVSGEVKHNNNTTTPPKEQDVIEAENAVKRWEVGTPTLTSSPQPVIDGGNTPREPEFTFRGPKLITFDGDQTLYSDGANFESNPELANHLFLLLKNKITVAVVTAAGYEYQSEKYELRLSGLLAYFQLKGLLPDECERFFLMGGECNYLFRLNDKFKLCPVKEFGPGGWLTATKHMGIDCPANWADDHVRAALDISEKSFHDSCDRQKLRARVIRKKRAVGLVPNAGERIPREALDETVLLVQCELQNNKTLLPFCAFNGGKDAWVDVGNKRVGVQVLQAYLGIPRELTLHIGDQFLNTGNDYAARDCCPCVWITDPDETTYMLKSILRLAGVSFDGHNSPSILEDFSLAIPSMQDGYAENIGNENEAVDFLEMTRRLEKVEMMDVYTGELISKSK